MTDINHYLDFILTFFLIFGLAFEIPVAVLVLVITGIVSVTQLKAIRPYAFVGAFFIGMIFTPPDVLSQTLLAIPMYLLYEIGVFIAGRCNGSCLK